MAIGDSPEMQRMQEEAMRRAREMYLRANPQAAAAREQPIPTTAVPVAENTQNEQTETRVPRSVPLTQEERPKTEQRTARSATPPKKEPAKSIAPTPSILNTLMEDKDRTLILMLLILLSGEGQSNELMFALLYLLI